MITKPQLRAENLGITEEQKENLNKILDFAKTHPDLAFDMRWFIVGKNLETGRYRGDTTSTPVPQNHPCGTSCCLAGMGLQAGVKPTKNETWGDYIVRVYGIDEESDEFNFLFSASHTSSLPDAVRRLEYFLIEGLPDTDNFDTYEIPA